MLNSNQKLPKAYTGSARINDPAFDSASTANSVSLNKKRRSRDNEYRYATIVIIVVNFLVTIWFSVADIIAVVNGNGTPIFVGIWGVLILLPACITVHIITISFEVVKIVLIIICLVADIIQFFFMFAMLGLSIWMTIAESWGDLKKCQDFGTLQQLQFYIPNSGRLATAAMKVSMAGMCMLVTIVHIILEIKYLYTVYVVDEKRKQARQAARSVGYSVTGNSMAMIPRKTGQSTSGSRLSMNTAQSKSQLRLELAVPHTDKPATYGASVPQLNEEYPEGEQIYVNTNAPEEPVSHSGFGPHLNPETQPLFAPPSYSIDPHNNGTADMSADAGGIPPSAYSVTPGFSLPPQPKPLGPGYSYPSPDPNQPMVAPRAAVTTSTRPGSVPRPISSARPAVVASQSKWIGGRLRKK